MKTTKAARIPFFGVGRAYSGYREKALERVHLILASGRLFQSEAVMEFESRLARMTGRQHGVAVGSCTDAFFFALVAGDVGAGSEVLVTSLSFVASASPVLRAGAVPVFVDVDTTDGHMDLDAATKAVTNRTAALLFPHLYGNMGDVSWIEDFARRHGLFLVEDAAQALGARRDGRMAGSMGDASCISFDPTKVVSAPGRGGIVLTDHKEIADRVRSLRYHGKDARDRVARPGHNSQMSAFAAAILDVKLDHSGTWEARRREIAWRYSAELAEIGIEVPIPPPNTHHIYHKYVIRTPERGQPAPSPGCCGDRYSDPLPTGSSGRAGFSPSNTPRSGWTFRGR